MGAAQAYGRDRLARIVLAAITFTKVLELLLLIIIVHMVLLAPVMLAVFRTWLEYQENQALRRQRASSTGRG
jgi:hypothetical protein